MKLNGVDLFENMDKELLRYYTELKEKMEEGKVSLTQISLAFNDIMRCEKMRSCYGCKAHKINRNVLKEKCSACEFHLQLAIIKIVIEALTSE